MYLITQTEKSEMVKTSTQTMAEMSTQTEEEEEGSAVSSKFMSARAK
jgi:hypothetical protein